MSDNLTETAANCSAPVCIDARRVYDSCSDKDCLSELPVYMSEESQALVDESVNVRIRSAEVADVALDIEPVPFNRGFYSIDITYFFLLTLDVYASATTSPQQILAVCASDKKVILYGSEGNVKVFSSDLAVKDVDIQKTPTRSLPTANVQVADPIALAVNVKPAQTEIKSSLNYTIPDALLELIGGNISASGEKAVFATLGVFSIVQLLRNVQMLIPSYDFCIPEKRCENSTDSPCDIFSRLDFPTDEFFPPSVDDSTSDSTGCGCGEIEKETV